VKGRFSVALGFLALIAVGAVVLDMPWMRTAGTWGNPLTAAFTACSAVCVTGLSVVDIAREFNFAGQIALLVLVQLGCLGLMTIGTFLIVAIGRRLSLSREFTLMNAYGVAEVQGLKGLICWVVGSMLFIEGLGAAVLYLHFHDVWHSVFYSAMSFCNAGFGLHPGSLAFCATARFPLLTMGALTILGGIGFLVIYNLCTFKFLRRTSGGRGRVSLHTKVVLRVSFWLLAATFALFMLLEWNGVLGDFGTMQKFIVGLYQSITPRTCGFCVTPTENLRPVTRLVYEMLMFIGGAPGSAAAGMKVTTLAVLLYTLIAMCRGETETVIYRRTIPQEIVRESLVIFMALVVFVALVTGLLLFTEQGNALSSDALFFEAVSAITTTGLSMSDTTARLTPWGKGVIMLAMFVGRLGALAVVMMIGDRESVRHIRYPSEELVVG